MTRRNSRRDNPVNIRHALELCVNHAKSKHNLGVERIVDLMGESSTSTVYKWLESGRMPVMKLRAFENVCDVDYVTHYLAHSAGYLLLKVPTGRKAEHRDLNELSQFVHEALGLLCNFYDSHEGADETMAALTQLMEDLAFQRGNIEKFKQPELL